MQLQNTRSSKIANRQDLYSSTDSNKKQSYRNFSDIHAIHALFEEPIGERGQVDKNALAAKGCVQKVDDRAGRTTCNDLAETHDAASSVSEVQSPSSSTSPTSTEIAKDSSSLASKNFAGTPVNEIKKELDRPA